MCWCFPQTVADLLCPHLCWISFSDCHHHYKVEIKFSFIYLGTSIFHEGCNLSTSCTVLFGSHQRRCCVMLTWWDYSFMQWKWVTSRTIQAFNSLRFCVHELWCILDIPDAKGNFCVVLCIVFLLIQEKRKEAAKKGKRCVCVCVGGEWLSFPAGRQASAGLQCLGFWES
jgi:hypothetical protein